jgi:xanthine dehydrogenase accessory factor
MRDVFRDVEAWTAGGETVALATVVSTWGSAPRSPGSKMAVSASGRIAGSVSGGCVEGAVAEAAHAAIATGRPRLLHFGVADETAWAVGLACGGTIDVFVGLLDEARLRETRRAIEENRALATATVLSGPAERLGSAVTVVEGDPEPARPASDPVAAAALEALAEGRCRRLDVGEADVFVDVVLPPPTLVVVGGVHIAVALVALARTLGYRTVVVDPRTAFGNRERFPDADDLLTAWPDEAFARLGLHSGTAVAVLTHDPKIDDPALMAALPSSAFYVGALGSPRTHEKRRRRLGEAGLEEAHLTRLHAPIGLDLGGRRPEEIALAVMAEIVAARNGRGGR